MVDRGWKTEVAITYNISRSITSTKVIGARLSNVSVGVDC